MIQRGLLLLAILASLEARAGSIQGTASYAGVQTGLVMIALATQLEDPEFLEGFQTNAPSPWNYSFQGLETGAYYVVAVMVTDPDYDPLDPVTDLVYTDPWGGYMAWSNPVVVPVTEAQPDRTGMDFELIDGEEGTERENPFVDEEGSNIAPRVCNQAFEECFCPPRTWQWEGRRVPEEYFFDVSVIQLTNGDYRMYGNSADQILTGTNAFDSYLSTNGIDFVKEPGHRLVAPGIFMPSVIRLTNGDIRCYYSDQDGSVSPGSRAFKSALSTNGGTDFIVEPGDLLVYTDGGVNEARGIRGCKILGLTNGRFRLFYHAIDGAEHWRVLSASSDNGLDWTRDPGVRIDPLSYCDSGFFMGNVAPFIPFRSSQVLLYVVMRRCVMEEYDIGGMFEAVSSNGLDFTVATQPILESFYTNWTGDYSNSIPITAQDPAVIWTPAGTRLYVGLYQAAAVITNVSGIYSLIKPDFDDDRSSDRDEMIAGTDPSDPDSVLKVVAAENPAGGSLGALIRWSSVSGIVYRIQRGPQLDETAWVAVSPPLTGAPPVNVFTDTTASGSGPFFFRTEVQP